MVSENDVHNLLRILGYSPLFYWLQQAQSRILREITAGLQQGFIVVNHGGFIPEVSLNICLIADVKRRAERVRSEWAERGRDQIAYRDITLCGGYG